MRSARTSYLFVDGESLSRSLREISRKYFNNESLEISWDDLKGEHRKVYYYDAIPVQSPDEDENAYACRIAPKRQELASIERNSGHHVRTGDVHRRRTRGNEQKMVDVQLAVDALLMASRGLFDSCTLVTSDLDFRPLVVALVEMGIDVTLRYAPGSTNPELLVAADNAYPIELDSFRRFLKLTETQRSAVPRAYSLLQTQIMSPRLQLIQWDDPNYGICQILKQDEGYVLVTQRSLDNPDTHRLVISCNVKGNLRTYADEQYNLSIPDF